MAEEIEENSEARVFAEAPAAPAVSNLPFIITLAALLVYFSFQSLSLLNERANLAR